MSNNFDGPVLIDNGLLPIGAGYLGFGRVGNDADSNGPRLYAAANLATINGVLAAPAGSLAMLQDATTARNTDGGTTWELIGGGPAPSLSYQEVTVLSAASADLEAEPTRNIAYTGDNIAISQALPDPGASGRKLYRFLMAGTGESDLTFTYAGAGGIVGRDIIFGGPLESATLIYGSDADAWYVYPGSRSAP